MRPPPKRADVGSVFGARLAPNGRNPLQESSADEPAMSVGSSRAPDVVAGEVMEALALHG